MYPGSELEYNNGVQWMFSTAYIHRPMCCLSQHKGKHLENVEYSEHLSMRKFSITCPVRISLFSFIFIQEGKKEKPFLFFFHSLILHTMICSVKQCSPPTSFSSRAQFLWLRNLSSPSPLSGGRQSRNRGDPIRGGEEGQNRSLLPM